MIGVVSLLVVVALGFLIEPDSVHPNWTTKKLNNQINEIQRVNRDGEQGQYLFATRTIEDLLDATILQDSKSCHIEGAITGDTDLVHSIGVYSNDFRVVLYASQVNPDGTFSVSNILPGTYRAAPLAKGNQALLFSPSMGHHIFCDDGQRYSTSFFIDGTRDLHKKRDSDRSVNGTADFMGPQRHARDQATTNPAHHVWSPKQRHNIVLRILRGHSSFETAARDHNLTIEELFAWRDQFLLKAEKALQRHNEP